MKFSTLSPVHLKAFNIPTPEAEVRFHPTRRWRFDYAWKGKKVAVELEGGVWQYGRHNRAASYIKDMEKYNAAAELGWKVLRYTPQNIDYEQIARVLS